MALDSYNDILAHALRSAEEPTDGTSEFATHADNAIIEGWRDLYTRWPWLILRKYPDGAFSTVAPVTSLTLTASAGSAVVGTLSAVYATSLLNYVVLPQGKNYLIRITAHTAGTDAVTLDVVPEALTSATTLTIAKIEYDLASDLGLFVNGLWTNGTSFVALQSLEDLLKEYALPPACDVPQMFARVGETKIRLAGYPTAVRRFDYPYNYEPADPSGSGTLALPTYVRPALGHKATAAVMELKGDSRWKDRDALAERIIERAISTEIKKLAGAGRLNHQAKAGTYGDRRRRWGRW